MELKNSDLSENISNNLRYATLLKHLLRGGVLVLENGV